MPAIKFIRPGEPSNVRLLRGEDGIEHSFCTESSAVGATYEFDLGTSMYLRLRIDENWLDEGDIDELIEFLKAAKQHNAEYRASASF